MTLASINKAARYARYEDSFVWLRDAGVALPCYNVSAPSIPLRLNEQRTLFKLFMADTGLLCAAGMDGIQFNILNGDLSINMGSILENVFAQIFAANGFKLWYFNKQKYGELDFVLQPGRKCLPVEIKSGKDYRRHTALDNILSVGEWKFEEAVVFCMDNVSTDGKVTYLPWYMAMFLKTPQPSHTSSMPTSRACRPACLRTEDNTECIPIFLIFLKKIGMHSNFIVFCRGMT